MLELSLGARCGKKPTVGHSVVFQSLASEALPFRLGVLSFISLSSTGRPQRGYLTAGVGQLYSASPRAPNCHANKEIDTSIFNKHMTLSW